MKRINQNKKTLKSWGPAWRAFQYDNQPVLLLKWFRRFAIGVHRTGPHVATDGCFFLVAEVTSCFFPLSIVPVNVIYKEHQYRLEELESSQDLL